VSDTPNLDSREPVSTAVGQTPYSAWIQTDVLHSLQRTVSDHPGEQAWIVTVQVSELYWMLIVKEIQTAQMQLRSDNLTQAYRTLLRIVAHHEPLNATWRSLAWMTPTSGDQVPARVPGAGKLQALEDAPGSYVKVKE